MWLFRYCRHQQFRQMYCLYLQNRIWRQYVLLKLQYLFASLHGVTNQKTNAETLITMRTSNRILYACFILTSKHGYGQYNMYVSWMTVLVKEHLLFLSTFSFTTYMHLNCMHVWFNFSIIVLLNHQLKIL